LFRVTANEALMLMRSQRRHRARLVEGLDLDDLGSLQPLRAMADEPPDLRARSERSEEHTSELQSRENLVCRLLLEKKKKTKVRGMMSKRARMTKIMINFDNQVVVYVRVTTRPTNRENYVCTLAMV